MLNELFQQGIQVKVLHGIAVGEHTERSLILDPAGSPWQTEFAEGPVARAVVSLDAGRRSMQDLMRAVTERFNGSIRLGRRVFQAVSACFTSHSP